ncbi:MAG: GAF domain-containing protein [Anaerolineales bacterium]|nr:GAF domain-containing protein [Anaerolineales bacterium]
MNTDPTRFSPSPEERARVKSIFWTSVALAMAYLLGLVYSLILAQQIQVWQIFVAIGILAGLLLSCIPAIWWSRHERIARSAAVLTIGAALLYPVLAVLFEGLGIILGAGGLFGSMMISSTAFDQKQSRRALPVYITSAIVSILIEVFNPPGRLSLPTLQIVVAVLVALVLGTYVTSTARAFSSYSLRNKLIIFFTIIVIIAAASIASVTITLTRNALSDQVGVSSQALADRLGHEIGSYLQAQINLLMNTAARYQSLAAQVSSTYSGGETSALTIITNRDTAWATASDSSPLVRNVLTHPAAEGLQELQALSPENVEIFLTDKYGALIAATNRTSDYYQADEAWWQATYLGGQGAIHIGELAYDESSQTYALTIAVPIYDASHIVVGVLRTTLDANALIALLEEGQFGETGHSDLRLSEGLLLGDETLAADEIAALNSIGDNYVQINYQGASSVVSQARVQTHNPESPVGLAISQSGWQVVVHQQTSEALKPVQTATRTTTVVTLAVILAAAGLALAVSQVIARPILQLSEVAGRIASGDRSARAPVTTKDEIGDLATIFNAMTEQVSDLLSSLEQRVSERTADLEVARQQSEARARDLQNVGEVSSIIAREQRLEILLPLITRLVSEKFNFYHIGIFLIESTRQFAILQAANSEGGQRMLAREHKLAVGQTGIVGNVAQTGKPRIALDVGADAVFFNNPDLPETRSEMALPLTVRGQIIGVLDVQSTLAGIFTEDDVAVLGILADQVAVAIENARLFGQRQQALDEVDALYRQYLSQEWESFAQQDMLLGYHQSQMGGQPIAATVDSDEIQTAMSTGKILIVNPQDADSTAAMTVPVRLRGQTIGVLNLMAPVSGRPWSEDEVNMVQAVSDRLALALENARLLEATQRRAATERAIGDISSKISSSIDIESVLRTAVEEIGRKIGATQVVFELKAEQSEA